MESIVVQFVIDVREYQDETCYAHRQTENVNERIKFRSQDIPESNFEIVFQHTLSPTFNAQ
jgi:hypothetical protein